MQTLDINEICEKIMDSLFSLFNNIDNGVILLIDNETGELKEILARSRHNEGNIQSNYSRTIVNRVIGDGKAVIMADTSQEDIDNLSESIAMKRVLSASLRKRKKSEFSCIFFARGGCLVCGVYHPRFKMDY